MSGTKKTRGHHWWVPVDKTLTRKTETLQIAARTGLDRFAVAGHIIDLLALVDDEATEVGALPGHTPESLASVLPGTDSRFWRAVIEAGWLIADQGQLRISEDFETSYGYGREKAGAAARQRKSRAGRARQDAKPAEQMSRRCHGDVTAMSQNTVTTEQDRTVQDRTGQDTPARASDLEKCAHPSVGGCGGEGRVVPTQGVEPDEAGGTFSAEAWDGAFGMVWDAYPHPPGRRDRATARRYWQRLPREQRIYQAVMREIRDGLPNAKRVPENYLHDGRPNGHFFIGWVIRRLQGHPT